MGSFGTEDTRDATYILRALEFLRDYHFPVVFVALTALVVCSIAVVILRAALLPVADKFALWILLTATIAIVVTAVIVRSTQLEAYHELVASEAYMAAIRDTQTHLEKLFQPPAIETPIYFFYVDAKQVNTLYNQMEPELEEKERTVERSNGTKIEAEVGIGKTGTSLEMNKSAQSKSTFGRTKAPMEKKCVSLMKYARDKWPSNHYERAIDWALRQFLTSYRDRTQAFRPTHANELWLSPEVSPEEFQKFWNQGRWADPAKKELSELSGLVFVGGEFQESRTGENVVLISEFSSEPFKALFKVTLPVSALQTLPTKRPLRVRVFGHVIKPFGDDDSIEVEPIAVY